MAIDRKTGRPIMIGEVPRSGRSIRRPVHSWNTIQHPWAITPFLLAPVIPGETMRSAVLQSRAVSTPIQSDIVGWWLEHHLYYVKVRDLDDRDELTNMFIDPDWQAGALASSVADPWHYFNGRGRVPWARLCLERVVDEYFRNEGEDTYEARYPATTGLPLSSIATPSPFDSLMGVGDYQPLDVDVDAGDDDQLQASEVEAALRQYEILKMNGLVEMTYEDFLRTYGIRGAPVAPVDAHRPELIRYERSWTYPSNTVELEGVRSVVSWNQAFRADKDRFFSEPGFILGITVARPKIYLSNQSSAASYLMDNIRTWLPAVLIQDPFTSLTRVPEDGGPLESAPDDYIVDIRDLLVHGDQWVNHTGSKNAVALPSADDFQKRYASAGDLAGLFVGETDAQRVIRQDGVCTFMIAGHNSKDYSPTTSATANLPSPD